MEKHGWFVAAINDAQPPFLYSIGLLKTYSHPDFIVFGLDSDNSYALLSGLISQVKAGRSFTKPSIETVDIGGNEFQVGFRPVHKSQRPLYLGYGMGFMRHIGRWGELEAMQVFWPDRSGKFPFEAGCELSVYDLQPRLDIPLTKDEEEEFYREFG